MKIISFPKAIYKGNSVNGTFSIEKDGKQYTFREDDSLIVGIKSYIGATEYILNKVLETQAGETSVSIILDPDDTKNLPIQKAVLELTLVNEAAQLIKTVYQEDIEIKGVVNDE